MTYAEKLKDPRWQKKRLEILERDGWKCMACGEKEKTLHIHHIFYLSGKEPWEIPDGLLITFCESCHKPSCEKEPCNKCDDFSLDKNNLSRCEGMGKPTEELVRLIGIILNDVWCDAGRYGGGDFNELLGNLHYAIK